jgi:hypothetical protein
MSRSRFALDLVAPFALAALACSCSSSSSPPANQPSPDAGADDAGDDAGFVTPPVSLPPWMPSAKIIVHGDDDIYADCRTVICRHNENTDLTTWNGAIWFVHRTAISQTLGPNSALHVYKSTDQGATFVETARIPAFNARDLRDPEFYQVGGDLYIKALSRLTTAQADGGVRDSNVDTATLAIHTSDGTNWSAPVDLAPHGWSFWRPKQQGTSYYAAAYQDGDASVVLFTSNDGMTWTQGPPIYTISADTPLETELTFVPCPSCTNDAGATGDPLLALVRMDGNDQELIGDQGRLRTKICWSMPPYTSFACPSEFDGQRLDGPVSFFWNKRLFVVARKHLQNTGGRKRTALFEITADGTGDITPTANLSIKDWGEIPSGGDTSYAGVAMTDATHAIVTWYSGDIMLDQSWVLGMFNLTDIWQGTIDFSKLQ